MAVATSTRKALVSIAFLLAAGLAAAAALRSGPPPPEPNPRSSLGTILPQGDPLLLDRAAQNWGYTAVRAAERHGEEGLHVLEAFEDEAAYCLEHQPEAFTALAEVVRLDPVRFRLASGPWNRAVLDWAQSGKLTRFVDRVRALRPDQLAVAEACPDALPLLCAGHSPSAGAMLDRHGDRAWRLFMAVNFAEHPEDLDRVASALDNEGERVLRLNEEYGLSYALLLVPPTTKPGCAQFPEVVKHALKALDDEPTALALILVNYETICALLNEGKSAQQIGEAIDQFAALRPVVRELALDHKHTLRLLSESWHGQKLGAEVLRRCGPVAADLVYDYYASDEQLKWPALVSMAHLGESACQVFHRYRDYGKFHALLRRCAPDLMNPRENPPAVVHAIAGIARHGQEQVDIYAEVPNLKGQVLADVRGPLPQEAYLEWVPGYVAYRTVANYADGRHVTGGDVFWASVDAVSTATLLYGPVVNGFKTVGGKLGQEAGAVAAKEVTSQAERTLAREALQGAERKLGETAEKVALETLKREGAGLVDRFGGNAGTFATRRLQARTEGLAIKLADRREEYLKLAKLGDVNGKARVVEEIGLEGADRYVAEVGYEPLYRGEHRKGMGFDLPPSRDGDRIKVIEAKGGDSPLKTYRGHEQGTIEYTREVAEWTRGSPSTSAEEKKAAEEVLKAVGEGRLDVEVVRTSHVQGSPGLTRVQKATGPHGAISLSPEDARLALARAPGMTAAWVRQAGQTAAGLDAATWLKQAAPVADRSGIALWSGGSRPLTPREVVREGVRTSIPVPTLSPAADPTRVSEFAVALMERGI